MAKFRKKPVVIEAIQLVAVSETKRKYGTSIEYNSAEVAKFIGGIVRFPTRPNGTKLGRFCVEIDTLEGVMTGDVGDYIIKGVKGEFYPCKPDIFKLTYDVVD
jgi:hypothetical protein